MCTKIHTVKSQYIWCPSVLSDALIACLQCVHEALDTISPLIDEVDIIYW